MKFRYSIPLFIGLVFFSNGVFAQLVGDNAFLQGQFLEACIAPNGSWGNTMPVPAGYTSRSGSSLTYTDPITHTTATGNGLDFSYDQGHDGFAVGTPPWYGAFFLPGTPFDGWSVQIDDTMGAAFYSSGDFDTTLGGNFGGTVTGYSGPTCNNLYAAKTGTWTGTYGLRRAGMRNAMQIVQVNEIDTFASMVNVTTKFYNTTDSTLTGVYYMATGDPDNDEDLPGGSFPTNNHISYQGGALDRHEVSARPPSLHQDAFSGLATQDCRAKVLIYESWPPPMLTGNDLDLVWGEAPTGMGSTYYTVGASTLSEDIAYGIIFNVGNIKPHDSAFISFAWVFSDTTAVDSIFTTSPGLSTEGVVHSPSQPDSVFGCNMMGCGVSGDSTFTADIVNGENRNWSFSNWTWTPSIGLSGTTGRHVIVNIHKLVGPTTYTITGIPDATRGSCTPPAPVSFTLYVQPCFSAGNNGPCLNDTLYLIGTGDTAGAMFTWTGPGGYTSIGESTFRFPLTMADTGVYRLIKSTGTDNDTTYTDVSIKKLPVVTATANTICSRSTLLLKANPDSVGETFSWTGPNSFTSGMQDPDILNTPVSDSGLYRVITFWNGCTDTGFVDVKIDSTPAIPMIGSNSPICSQYGILFLTSGDATPGISGYNWSGPAAFTSTLQNPVVAGLSTASSGVYTVTATINYTAPVLSCSDSNTISVAVDSTPYLPVLTSNSPVCSGTPLNLTATSSPGSDYSWTGPNSFTNTTQNPTIDPATTAATGIYSVTASIAYTATLTCTSNPATIAVVVDSTPLTPVAASNSPGAPGVSICQGDTLKLYSSDSTAGVGFIWQGPNSFISTNQNPEIINVMPTATGQYTVTATNGSACTAATVITVSITPTPPLTATSNSPVCSGDSLELQASSDPGATYSWTGPYTFSSTLQNPSRNPAIMEYGGIYQVVAVVSNCPSLTINDTVVMNQTPPAPWVKWITYCQNYPAPPLQASGDNILWYSSVVPPLAGSSIPPVPSTAQLGQAYYFVTQTVQNCISSVDSIQVTVYPIPVITLSASIGICPHDSAVLKVTSSDSIAYYHWSPAMYLSDTSGATIVARPDKDIAYTVVVSNEFNCTDTGHVSVSVNSGALLSLPEPATIYPGETYQISPQTNCSYFSWFPPQGLDNATLSDPVASPSVSTRYVVQGTTSWGCTVTDSIDIIVAPGAEIALPNAFSPGNGPDNIFKIIKRGIVQLKSFNIFDRWGVLVFSTTDINAGWDGTYKGTPQPFGVYVYEITAVASDGSTFTKQGNLTLVR